MPEPTIIGYGEYGEPWYSTPYTPEGGTPLTTQIRPESYQTYTPGSYLTRPAETYTPGVLSGGGGIVRDYIPSTPTWTTWPEPEPKAGVSDEELIKKGEGDKPPPKNVIGVVRIYGRVIQRPDGSYTDMEGNPLSDEVYHDELRKAALAAGIKPPAQLPTEDPGVGNRWIWDGDQHYAGPIESMSPYEQEVLKQGQIRWEAQQAADAKAAALEQQKWQQQQGLNEQQQAWLQQYQGGQLELQQQNLAWQKEQAAAQLAQEQKNYLANLAANPRSWLEYASAAGTTPAIQPWMTPLMPQQYAGTVAGAALPGWQGGSPSMAQLPALTTPSTQYQARMGPTAYQQYAGYEQARTGINPTELQFRLWSQSPPGGSTSSLSYMK